MRAIGMRAIARSVVRLSQDHKTRLYYAACVVLLVAAAGLRFHDLSGKSVWNDEAFVADNSSGSLSEVVPNTRHKNSSPILYPLVLWAVQKVDVSAFSIRVLPAAASVLTVAVLLFLLPRAGVSRWAAFLAALLATLSVAAIEHAQGAREYSIDALLATLMITGLLWYLRHGRKVLLCVSLFLAPLLQYGLVLFGVAVIGAAVVLSPSPTLGASEQNSYLSRIPHWLRQRIALLLPAACFLAACAISYLMTARYQWQKASGGKYSHHLLPRRIRRSRPFRMRGSAHLETLGLSPAARRCHTGRWGICPDADGIPEKAALRCHCNLGPAGRRHRHFRRHADNLSLWGVSPKPLSGARHL